MSKQSKLLLLIAVGIFLILAACNPTPTLVPTPTPRILIPSPFPTPATGSISGRVMRQDGKTPISEAGIIANGTISANLKTILTQKDGTYLLDKLTPDTYQVDVILPGYEDGRRTGIVVSANQRLSGIDFNLRSESTISGKVTQADGKTPIADASVFASGPHGEPGAAVTAKDGTYTVLGLLTPGLYRVEVFKEGSGFASQKVTIPEAGGAVQGINFSTFGGIIIGQVTRAEDGTPIAGAAVIVIIDTGSKVGFEPQSLTAATQTGSDGRYQLESLQSLPYTLQVIFPGYGTEVRSVQVSQGTKPAETNVSMKLGGTISGQVTDMDGTTPRNGAKLRVFDSNSHLIYSASEVVTDSKGEYKFVDLAAGSYTILCSIADSVFILKSNIGVVAAQNTPNMNFRPEKAVGNISGKIVQSDGITPIPQAVIIILSDAATGSAESAGNGTYRVDGLPAGVYTILVAIPGYENVTRDGIVITAGGTTQGIDFRLKPQ